MDKNKQVKEALEKGWKISVTYSKEESYCFVFSNTGKELGFAKMPGFNPGVIEKAFERALEKIKQLESLKEDLRKKQPLLYSED